MTTADRRRLTAALLLALALSAPAVLAQPRLAFEAEAAAFGRIAEADGPTTRTFRFTNAGDAPLRLARVEAQCGCTTPAWTSAAVAPGASGTVEVAYDPDGRPGPFDRTVFVDAGDGGSAVLQISGVVEPRLAREGVRVGSFAFRETTADAGPAAPGEPAQTAFQFAHVGERPVRIVSVEVPDNVDVAYSDRPVFPDALGGLFVTVYPDELYGTEGPFEIAFSVHTDDPSEPVKVLTVTGTLGAE